MAEKSRFDLFTDEFKKEDFVKVGETQTFTVTERPELYHLSEVRFSEQELEEPVIVLSLHDAAEQALWDLRQWVEDHPATCDCYTCKESIPDLERALGTEHVMNGPCC
jgi:hypothetical protein